MSSVILSGDTSGTVTLTVPATAGSNTVTLPAVTGTAVVAGQNSAITAGTAVASTSGTSITFSSIPSWVKRITVMLNGVSTNGTSTVQVQIGSGSVTTTGYLSCAWQGGTADAGKSSTTGFAVSSSTSAAYTYTGALILTLVSGNTWVGSGSVAVQPTSQLAVGALGGNVTLSGTLDRVVLTTVNGTDTFDAGSINILYE